MMASGEHRESIAEEKEEDIDAVRRTRAEEKARADANLAGWQRAQADLINYKRRAEMEREEISKFANSTLVLNLLPVLDDLERALSSVPDGTAGEPWLEGIRLIQRKFRGILEAQGLSPIEAVGEPFDPRFHEAVRQAEGEEGMVVEEQEKGYMFRDRVIRPSKVVVGVGEKEGSETEGEEPPSESQ
jgi:molecular chaperone GrpE